jgi:hypothetical protein
MKLISGRLRVDRPALNSRWDVLLGVVADFSIAVGERCLLHEEMFPVVELAVSLKGWIDDLEKGAVHDFWYESMESTEGPLLQFMKWDSGWKVRSPLQDFELEDVLTTEDLCAAACQFVEGIQQEAAAQLGLDLGSLIPHR